MTNELTFVPSDSDLTNVETAFIQGVRAKRMAFDWTDELDAKMRALVLARRYTPAPPTPPAPPAPPGAGPVITPLTWPFCEVAPAVMFVGGRYAFSFVAGAPYGGKSISVNEFNTPPRQRFMRIAADPNGDNVLKDAQGQPAVTYGIGGILIFGANTGQIALTPGVTYYLVVDMVGVDGQLSGPVGTDASAVVVLR